MTKQYGWWMQLSHDEFQHIVDPNNQVCIVLAAHWIALKQIMGTILETELKAGAQPPQPSKERGISVGIIRWLKYLNRLVDLEHLAYNQWPLWVEAKLDKDRGFFGRTM